MPTDVTDEEQVRALFARTHQRFGRVDVLVNNAAMVGAFAPLAELPLADWQAVRHMLPRRSGAIVNVASHAGKVGHANRCQYTASKFGLLGLTQALACEVGRDGIRVNAVCPGPAATEMLKFGWQQRVETFGLTYEEVAQEFLDKSALGRVTEPEEVAAVILFLATDEARAMTGQAINVTSGTVMH